MNRAIDAIRSLGEFKELINNLEQKKNSPPLGLVRSVRLPMLGTLWQEMETPFLFVVERMDQALSVADELGFWIKPDDIQLFPEPSPTFYENAAWGALTRRDRLQTLISLSDYHLPGAPNRSKPKVILTTVRGLMTRTIPRRDFISAVRKIATGQSIQPDQLIKEWVGNGYQPVDIVLEPGCFSRRGGILDIWIVSEPNPYRIDFFGDEIDSIRRFDAATQRTLGLVEKITILPASEILNSKAQKAGIVTENLNEFSIPLVYPYSATILDYLPKTSLILLNDRTLIRSIADEIEEQAVQFREASIQNDLIASDFPLPYVTWSEIEDILPSFQTLDFGYPVDGDCSLFGNKFRPGERFNGRLKVFLDYLEQINNDGSQIMVVTRQLNRIKTLWQDRRVEDNQPDFMEGSLSEGWIPLIGDNKEDFVLITDSEIFGWDRPHPRKRSRPRVISPESEYTDLQIGDWVVHIDFGIGKFAGLVKRTLEGIEREYLCVEYAAGDQLFVPIHQADRIGRYVGADGSPPTPTRLGTQEWVTVKSRVKEAVQEIAEDLLELYARRQIAIGTQFSADTVWQHELEGSFPYIETEDQKRAILEVKKDMETSRPMDRLLCGDVGYGKTEVALRAAFKACMDGKQVAILVPTTVLAQQHFETFRERLKPFPLNVEMLSRFRSAKEQDEIILKLMLGQIDIVIGTHRLLSRDVEFKDLGLVIIDEEQRFGVTHKEFFKKLRMELDVLTLTATPIPRTLYMALTGVRDISIINTPPAERQPVVTHIGPYSQALVRQAIMRELERGGQVFFVHNRVHTIDAMKVHLNNLVPEARIGIGHGQMNESELSRVMRDFTDGEIDVLLCTSIIESGLDIPNANTLIVDRGDTFGLAQLYQLRGRVGRGAQRAYAYFFRHRKKPATIEGQERLETIAEHSQLGAGFSIAMRDLEMRGAGELLGTKQHGMISSVGFHLYTRLLGDAVGRIKGGNESIPNIEITDYKQIRIPVSVDLPLPIGLPTDYISDQRMRLGLYRRIAEINDNADLLALEEEFIDRFGNIPDEVSNLFYQIRIRMLAERAGLASIGYESNQIVLRFPTSDEKRVMKDLSLNGNIVRGGKNSYWLNTKDHQDDWQEILRDLLESIITSDPMATKA